MTPHQTDPALLKALEQAAQRPVSAKEIQQQRISFIVASLRDDDASITSEKVQKELSKLEGFAA